MQKLQSDGLESKREKEILSRAKISEIKICKLMKMKFICARDLIRSALLLFGFKELIFPLNSSAFE